MKCLGYMCRMKEGRDRFLGGGIRLLGKLRYWVNEFFKIICLIKVDINLGFFSF